MLQGCHPFLQGCREVFISLYPGYSQFTLHSHCPEWQINLGSWPWIGASNLPCQWGDVALIAPSSYGYMQSRISVGLARARGLAFVE